MVMMALPSQIYTNFIFSLHFESSLPTLKKENKESSYMIKFKSQQKESEIYT